MPEAKNKLNRGQILEAAVKSFGRGKKKIAKKAGYSRSAYYKHIADPNLDYHILMAYGRALKHDFTEEFPDMPKYLEDPEEIYGPPKTFEDAIRQLDYWKNKCLETLEKYNRLIEEKLDEKTEKK